MSCREIVMLRDSFAPPSHVAAEPLIVVDAADLESVNPAGL